MNVVENVKNFICTNFFGGFLPMESFIEVFNLVKSNVKQQITDVAYNCWITFIEPVKFHDNKAIIYIKTVFQREILEKQYLDKIKTAFADVLGFPIDVVIATEEDINLYIDSDSSSLTEDSILSSEETIDSDFENLNGTYEYTFDTFIVGSSNNFAYAACKAITTNQSGSYNPLFIYGPSGLGKTHLLTAIKNEFLKNAPEKQIISVSSELFTNELINSISTKNISNFHLKYRNADVLLVDDIQFIAGKERTQEEFFHTFNELFQQGKQIVLTSDRPPKDIKTLEDRLKTRFEWGLLTDISIPDFETRIAIIHRKAALLQIKIPHDVAEYIANKIKTNIRQLEGAVKKLKANKLLLNASPSISMAQTVVKEILNDHQPTPMTVEKIIEEVSKTFSVSPEDIRSSKRSATIANARQAAIYIVREITGLALTPIGEEFGGRDHSTIVYSLKQFEKIIAADSRQKEIVEDIIKNIKNK